MNTCMHVVVAASCSPGAKVDFVRHGIQVVKENGLIGKTDVLERAVVIWRNYVRFVCKPSKLSATVHSISPSRERHTSGTAVSRQCTYAISSLLLATGDPVASVSVPFGEITSS